MSNTQSKPIVDNGEYVEYYIDRSGSYHEEGGYEGEGEGECERGEYEGGVYEGEYYDKGEYDFDGTDYDEAPNSYDKLILKLEEVDSESGSIKTSCYVAYHHTEKEYFVCGKYENEEEDFKFYCKSRKTLIEFLRYSLGCAMGNVNARVNNVLYNHKDLFWCCDTNKLNRENGDDLDKYCYLDYDSLRRRERYREKGEECVEIAGYDGVVFKTKWVSRLLKMLKQIRY